MADERYGLGNTLETEFIGYEPLSWSCSSIALELMMYNFG
jgi:hypothetical protein